MLQPNHPRHDRIRDKLDGLMLDVAERRVLQVGDLVRRDAKPTAYVRHLKLARLKELGIVGGNADALPLHALLKDERVQDSLA